MSDFGTSLDIGRTIKKDELLKKKIEEAACAKCARGEAVTAQRILNELGREELIAADAGKEEQEAEESAGKSAGAENQETSDEEIYEENIELENDEQNISDEDEEDSAFESIEERAEKEKIFKDSWEELEQEENYQDEEEQEEQPGNSEEYGVGYEQQEEYAEQTEEENSNTAPPEDELDVNEIIEENNKPKKQHREQPKTAPAWTSPVLIIIILITSFLVLSQPAKLGSIDAKAQKIIEQQLEAETAKKISAEWPMLGPEAKEQKKQEELKTLLKSEKTKKAIEQLAKQLRPLFTDKTKLAYNYIPETYEHLNSAVTGKKTLTGQFIAYLYFIQNILGKASPEKAAFYLPVVLGMISALLFYFIAKKTGKNSATGFIGALLLLMHPVLIRQNLAGHAGAQTTASFLMILAAFLLVCGLTIKNKLRLALCTILSATALVMFARSGIFALPAPGIKALVPALGGKALALLLGISVVWLLHKNIKHKPSAGEIFALCWLAVVLLAGIFASQMLFVLCIPATLVSAMLLGKLPALFAELPAFIGISANKKYAKTITTIVIPVIIFACLTGPQTAGIPAMDDAIYNSAIAIKTSQPAGTTIYAMPSTAPMLQYYSQRQAISDKNILAKALMSENEQDLINILSPNTTTSIAITENELAGIAEITALAVEDADREYFASTITNCLQNENTLFCAKKFAIDLETMNTLPEAKEPAGVIVFDDNGKREKEYYRTEAKATLVIYKAQDEYFCFLIDKRLKNTMLVNLISGSGLENLTKIYEAKMPERIVVWQMSARESAEKTGAPEETGKEKTNAEKTEKNEDAITNTNKTSEENKKDEQKLPASKKEPAEKDLSDILIEGIN